MTLCIKPGIATSCIFLCAMTFSFAQKADTLYSATATEKSQAIALKMQTELSLSDRQAIEVYQLCLERFAIIGEERKNNSEQLRVANVQSQKRLAEILTPNQHEIYVRLKEDTKRQREVLQEKNPHYRLSDEDKELDL